MAFGDKLHHLRQQAGLSQGGLAEQAGLSVRSIQNWEQGHRGPSATVILALAAALKVPAEVLLQELADDAAKGRKQPKRPRGRPRKDK